MVKRKRIFPYFCLLLVLFCFLSASKPWASYARERAVSTIAPSWEALFWGKEKILHFSPSSPARSEEWLQKMEEIKRENRALVEQVEYMRKYLTNEEQFVKWGTKLKALIDAEEPGQEQFLRKKREQLLSLLKLQAKAIPGKVIYRDPVSWSSFLWLNVGEKQNQALQEEIIAKNSPVVIGNVLVGIVEEVKETKCKVRLITDACLHPAVRAVRGSLQEQCLQEQIEKFKQLVKGKIEILSQEEKCSFFSLLEKLSSQLEKKSSFLAKGELQGGSEPLWRARGQKLKGIGFNYDFSDEEGSARDLRKDLDLIKEGDLLLTSGLDGIFPAGLEVAVVTKVFCLREGASSYEIEAQSVAENLHEVNRLFILPPLLGRF